MNRFARFTAVVLMICALSVAPIRSVGAQDDAQAQLEATASAMLALQSFHFELVTTAGKTVFQDAFELKGVQGDVVRPANFQAAVDVNLVFIDVTLEVVGVDGSIWVKNPIGGDDSFVQVAGGDTEMQLPPMELLNPDHLVLAALQYLEDPQIAGTEDLDGQPMTVVTGTFDPSQLLDSATATPAESMIGQVASRPLDVKMWIDSQNRLVQIDLTGPLFSFEEGTGRLVRRVTFSNFDADITIEPPAQAS